MPGRRAIIPAVLAAALALSACGSGARQDAGAVGGSFPVQITQASFPTSQRISEHTDLVVTVRNAGTRTIPDLAITITDPPYGTAVQAFGAYFPMSGVAYHSRAVWIIDEPPGPCGYSCQNGGMGADVTALANTWALGRLAPGQTATFRWGLTAVQPGRYQVAYRIAPELYGKARAELTDGAVPQGSFSVEIDGAPAHPYVDNNGNIVGSGPPAGAEQGAAGPQANGGSLPLTPGSTAPTN